MAKAAKRIQASPTKRFFVSMLTRDIELKDAILDLLDNCVDGVVRKIGSKQEIDKPYDGYFAHITANETNFTISDNCGGIPRDIAETVAFHLGRPQDVDENVHTVGMYGIGMKRAIFKLGQNASVRSKNKENGFKVEITKQWLEDQTNWELILEDDMCQDIANEGTTITVNDLYDNVQQLFSNASGFVDELEKTISQHYARIIEKGFTVYVNEVKITGADLVLLFEKNSKKGISPYIFTGTIDSVDVKLIVGFHRYLASENEIDEESVEPRKSTSAGWTIMCNDRVVLYKDKSRLTGWGLRGVPQYHTQFISISGVVELTSKKLLSLPLNTTKRGIDINSEVYITILQEMMTGMKKFTDFTNQWKGREGETQEDFKRTTPTRPDHIVSAVNDTDWTKVRNIPGTKDARRFIPSLPTPPTEQRTRRIIFSRPTDQIRILSSHLFGEPDSEPSQVGEVCFDKMLEAVTAQKKR